MYDGDLNNGSCFKTLNTEGVKDWVKVYTIDRHENDIEYWQIMKVRILLSNDAKDEMTNSEVFVGFTFCDVLKPTKGQWMEAICDKANGVGI